MIEAIDFQKNYGKFEAVKKISFKVKKGLITGFVGKNGAGKTTTIHALLDLIRPTSGTLSIAGYDSKKDANFIKKLISYVPSEVVFYKNTVIKDIFKFATKIQNTSLDEAMNLANYFELDATKKFSELSLGNKKKVAIILALIKDAELYIFDEPTSGLDPYIQEKFFIKLLEKKQNGATIFLSSHNLSEIEKYADEVIIIKDGSIVETIKLAFEKQKEELEVIYKTKQGELQKEVYCDDINLLIQKLSKLDLAFLEIKKVSIENRFLKYYEENDNENAN